MDEENIDVTEWLENMMLYKKKVTPSFLIDYSRCIDFEFYEKRVLYGVSIDSPDFIQYKDTVLATNYDGKQIKIGITINSDIESALKLLKLTLHGYTYPNIPQTKDRGIFIGDFAYGGLDYEILFTRGNVFVDIRNTFATEISVIELAKEIDRQLLEALQ